MTAHLQEPKTPRRSPMPRVGSPRRLRLGLIALGAGSLLVYISVILRITGRPVFLRWGFPQIDFLGIYVVHFLLLLLLALAGSWWVFRSQTNDPATLGVILGFALAFRLALLPTPPVLSSDIFRYVWDARIQAAGVNPYLSRPADYDSDEVKRDPLYQQQNRPFARTIYPPLAQAAFRTVRAVAGEGVTAMKGLMLFGDLGSLAILIHLLGALGLPRSRVILYAWQPLTVFEIAGSGHLDALAIPFMLLAVVAWRGHRNAAAGVALGAATLVKIFPIVLVPAFLGRKRWSLLLACVATIGLAYLPFLPGAGPKALGHLPQFLSDPGETFNPSLIGL
ncbi:MAG TPA: glycosyltransferase 87 family protein, partial [Candidatus Methylomirabilis sp.]|nr:glycosyltransferase 87 family protein [Candidatus Methylomirabilis sp.]